jgi:hypothetical protein
LYWCNLLSEDTTMRHLIYLCAAAMLFAAGCSKTNDGDRMDNPTPPADQSATPSTMPPADQPAPDTGGDATPPPADQTTPAPDQTTPPQQ